MGLPTRRKKAKESERKSQAEALKRAIKFLSYRGRSEAELRAKLFQLAFPQEIVEVTLEKLRCLNLLNDEAFARDWAVARSTGRGYGPLRLARELQEKGVAKELIDKVVKETSGAEEVKERAKRVLAKRFSSEDLTDQRVLRRAVTFLRRRGYRDSLISELVGGSCGDN